MSKKAVYTFVFYPEHGDPDPIIWGLNAMQWQWHLSPLHDRDVNKDGTPKKPHYHFLVGFSKNAPDLATFKQAVESLSPGVSCSPKAKQCLCDDPESAEDYQTHNGFDDKAQYSDDDCQFSEGWNVKDYATKEQKEAHARKLRMKAKADYSQFKADALSFFFDWLSSDNNPCEIAHLMDYIRMEKPEFFPVLLDNLYAVKSYADSKRYSCDTSLERSRDACAVLSDRCAKLEKQVDNMVRCSTELHKVYNAD